MKVRKINMQQENKMGVMPVNRLLLGMSFPIMMSMLVQALYNIVDSIFVSRISENALTAVSLAFPIQQLMIAVGVGTAVGVNALLSRSLGEREFERANKVAKNGIFLAALSYIAFLFVGIFVSGPFFASQTKVEEILVYGEEYLTICCCASFGIIFQCMLERLLQATGKTFYTMIMQGVGAIINIILDPILIFGYFGFPA
ncbi:MAG: MATE family efflux transporter, partial [Lachnospiraceae bacterium]|nr:MATE family efflux transporter [Lachnospiraceae bacterium]